MSLDASSLSLCSAFSSENRSRQGENERTSTNELGNLITERFFTVGVRFSSASFSLTVYEIDSSSSAAAAVTICMKNAVALRSNRTANLLLTLRSKYVGTPCLRRCVEQSVRHRSVCCTSRAFVASSSTWREERSRSLPLVVARHAPRIILFA